MSVISNELIASKLHFLVESYPYGKQIAKDIEVTTMCIAKATNPTETVGSGYRDNSM